MLCVARAARVRRPGRAVGVVRAAARCRGHSPDRPARGVERRRRRARSDATRASSCASTIASAVACDTAARRRRARAGNGGCVHVCEFRIDASRRATRRGCSPRRIPPTDGGHTASRRAPPFRAGACAALGPRLARRRDHRRAHRRSCSTACRLRWRSARRFGSRDRFATACIAGRTDAGTSGSAIGTLRRRRFNSIQPVSGPFLPPALGRSRVSVSRQRGRRAGRSRDERTGRSPLVRVDLRERHRIGHSRASPPPRNEERVSTRRRCGYSLRNRR